MYLSLDDVIVARGIEGGMWNPAEKIIDSIGGKVHSILEDLSASPKYKNVINTATQTTLDLKPRQCRLERARGGSGSRSSSV